MLTDPFGGGKLTRRNTLISLCFAPADTAPCGVWEGNQAHARKAVTPPPLGKIDWFFSRGLIATDARTLPAVDEGGRALSDHEVLVVTVRPA